MAIESAVRVDTFTPIFDAVVQDVGLVGASVYGRIWRYCQGNRQCCNAALKTIAESLNLSTRTIMRWTDELCTKGYLKDHTPDLKNKPHTYTTTSKLRLVVEVRAEIDGMTESHPAVTESHSDSDTKSLEETSNIPEETDQESAAPSPCDTTPTSFEGWLRAGQETTNKNAVLKRMHDALYPDRESPSYSYIGKVAKAVGGPGRLAQLLWETAGKRPTGDVLAYILATVKPKKRDATPDVSTTLKDQINAAMRRTTANATT